MIDQQAVLAVIRAALDGIPAEGAGISFDEYLAFARKQHIEALFIYGLMKSKIPLPKEVRNVYIRAAMTGSRQLKASQTLFAAFREHGIDYLPLKGSKLKFLYPDEAIRSMGDIDVLVRVSQYDAIRAVMLSLGYTEQTQSDHEYIWRGSEALVELHKRLIPSYNKDYYAYFGEGWQLAKKSGTSYEYEMAPEDTFIYLFTHYAKHYRDSGVGIRQVLDLYVFRKAYPEMNKGYIREKMALLQLEKFYVNTMHLLAVWFGDAEHTESSQLISDRLFDCGVFGSHENSVYSTMIKQANAQGSVKKAKVMGLLRKIFPSFEKMAKLYPVLRRFPPLLPLTWVLRWGDFLLHRQNQIRNYAREDTFLSEEGVTAYHEMLRKSGLDFNFK